MAFKQFAWVPDGIYDYTDYCVRYVLANGNPTMVISKMWVDSGGPDHVSSELKQPWGAFPTFPPKPPKNMEQK
jgi:hypothetical protein